MCILVLSTLLIVVSQYDLSVLSMSVIGLKKNWMRVREICEFVLLFLVCRAPK